MEVTNTEINQKYGEYTNKLQEYINLVKSLVIRGLSSMTFNSIKILRTGFNLRIQYNTEFYVSLCEHIQLIDKIGNALRNTFGEQILLSTGVCSVK